MTSKERVEKLRCLITCMKCEVSGKECDNNCPTQYDTGNMGEIIENLEEIAKALEQQPCEDAISKQAVLDLAKKGVLISNGNYDSVCKAINELPPVKSQPKTGYWHDKKMKIKGGHGYTYGRWGCSVCKKKFESKSNFCPNCGAKMESEG